MHINLLALFGLVRSGGDVNKEIAGIIQAIRRASRRDILNCVLQLDTKAKRTARRRSYGFALLGGATERSSAEE